MHAINSSVMAPAQGKTWDIEDIDVKVPKDFKGSGEVTSFFRKHKPLTKAHKKFYSRITRFIPSDRVYADDLRTFAFSVDASVYRLIPQVSCIQFIIYTLIFLSWLCVWRIPKRFKIVFVWRVNAMFQSPFGLLEPACLVKHNLILS